MNAAEQIRVSLVQTELVWENPAANRSALGQKLKALHGLTDLVILPEMFTTGFSLESAKLAETMDGESIAWMRNQAAEINGVVTGSLIIKEDGKYFNRMVWMPPDGHCSTYDKRHLFRMANEHHYFDAGCERVRVELKGWTVRLQVCYDLRFPVFSRNTSDHPYDLLIYVANWPAARAHPWSTLLLARAIENQCYVAGVNRVGKDGKGIVYSGNSALVDFKGEVMSHLLPFQNDVETQTLSRSELNAFREKFPVGLDADDFRGNW